MPITKAHVWQRVIAYLIDTAIFYAMHALVVYVFGLAVAIEDGMIVATPNFYMSYGIEILFVVGYYVYFLTYFCATPGKLLLRIRIASLHGGGISLRQILLRSMPIIVLGILNTMCFIHMQMYDLFRVLYLLTQVLMLGWFFGGFLLMCIHTSRRAFHDYLAETIVIQVTHVAHVPDLPKTWNTSSSTF